MQVVRSHDEEPELTYRVMGPESAPKTIVCLGGLGGTHLIWSTLARNLESDYRIVIWDYPGLVAGETYPPEKPLDVPALSNLLERVLNSLQVKRAWFAGWSFGVQLAAEFARLNSHRIAALAAVGGVAGRPFNEKLKTEEDPLGSMWAAGKATLPFAVDWLTERLEKVEHMRSFLRRIKHPTRWAIRLGFVNPCIDEFMFDSVVEDFLALNVDTYNRYAQAISGHDALDALVDGDFPVLALAGEKDRFLPPERIREMVDAIPGSEYFEVKGGTHYMPLEFGELIASKIDIFFSQRML
jgi:pimeloyl-ACP methyl ester carboxylesterase